MADDSGRVVWLWGPLLLVAVLVLVFRLSESGGVGSETGGERRAAPASALPANPPPRAVTAAPMPGGETRPPGTFTPHTGYPTAPYMTGPAPYPGAPGYPPWGWPHAFPRPGDHSGRYWGMGAAEWGPPIGEYGPDTEVDPYWWVTAEETER